MNNYQTDNPMTREDFHSFLLWKVFWKLLKRKTLLGFCRKAFVLVAGFILLSSFTPRLIGKTDEKRKMKAVNKSTANKRQTKQKVQTKADKK